MMRIVRGLDEQFARLHERSVRLVQAVPFEKLYWQPEVARARTFPVYSCGEHVLRSAAAVEQTFGGITVKDRKSTRLNSSHANISYAVFCLKKKTAHTIKLPAP